jgi:hypothetical protein
VVERLGEALAAADIELRRDIEHLPYGKSIQGFMDQIGAAGDVVVVLSDAYLKSPYCMYELLAIEKHQNFRQRVHPVWREDVKISDPSARVDYRKYWVTKRDELQEKLRSDELAHAGCEIEDLKRYDEFIHRIGELMETLAVMNALTLETHLQNDFAKLVDRIRSSSKDRLVSITGGNASDSQGGEERSTENEFDALVRKKLASILAGHLAIEARLAGDAFGPLLSRNQAAVEVLMSRSVIEAIDTVLFNATFGLLEKSRGIHTEDGWAVWATAHKLFSWLCLRAANSHPIGFGANAHAKIALGERTLCAVEVYVAKAAGRAVDVEVTPGTPLIKGRGAIDGFGEGGWGTDGRYQQLLVRIWSAEWPGRQRVRNSKAVSEFEPLSADEMNDLRAQLRQNQKHPHTRHRCYLALDLAKNELEWPLLLQRLANEFPELTVVQFRDIEGVPALIVDQGHSTRKSYMWPICQ